jgi:hypothetical protein
MIVLSELELEPHLDMITKMTQLWFQLFFTALERTIFKHFGMQYTEGTGSKLFSLKTIHGLKRFCI